MGSPDPGVFSKRKVSGLISLPRKWSSPLLSEEVTLQTLADTTYVRLMHADDVMMHRMCHGSRDNDDDAEAQFQVKGTRAGTAWSWLKRPVMSRNHGREVKGTMQLGLAKSKSLNNAWAWLGKPLNCADAHFHFDPSKRWPQGWAYCWLQFLWNVVNCKRVVNVDEGWQTQNYIALGVWQICHSASRWWKSLGLVAYLMHDGVVVTGARA